jgi:SAM-dependent methyltransferase
LSPDLAVLDIGCGEGAFLKSIRPLVARASGWDPTPQVAERAGEQGIDVSTGDLATFVAANRATFDVVCAFQVIEHLPRIQPLLRLALECLQPGGSLFVSVPNRLRLTRDSFEALDCPPHHMSRWSPASVHVLGKILDLDLVELSFEMLSAEDIRFYLRSSLARWSQNRIVGLSARLIMRTVFSEPLYTLYDRLGYLSWWGFFRMSMMAHYRRAGGARVRALPGH